LLFDVIANLWIENAEDTSYLKLCERNNLYVMSCCTFFLFIHILIISLISPFFRANNFIDYWFWGFMHYNASAIASMELTFPKSSISICLMDAWISTHGKRRATWNNGAQTRKSWHKIQMKFSQKARANPVSPFLDKPRWQAWRHLLMDRIRW
jgi:hypothetical protein